MRIFWMGAHKVLIETELARLRGLGYEVFNPPYLSKVQDQSANRDWDSNQKTTLPKSVFTELSRFNFFYNDISADVAVILNEYFDVVLVTISPLWLQGFLEAFRGKIVYRTFGQHYLVSRELEGYGLVQKILTHKNFYFLPFCKESLSGEQLWLRQLASSIPYCLPKDVFEVSNSWTGNKKQIALTCPNIQNAYFEEHYDFIRKNFSEDHFKIYGVQLENVDDPNVVGTLKRKELLASLAECAGYLYTHKEERVCYLPPIEMMVVGGPVLFLKGSLLCKFFEDGVPNRCDDIVEAKTKVRRLLAGDKDFQNELIACQSIVKERYTPDFVWPKFDKAIKTIFHETKAPDSIFIDAALKSATDKKRIYLLCHFPGDGFKRLGEAYLAYDGIPRVMRRILGALGERPDIEIVVTTNQVDEQIGNTHGFFSEVVSQNLKILFPFELSNRKGLAFYTRKLVVKTLKSMLTPNLMVKLRKTVLRIEHFIKRYMQDVRQIISFIVHNQGSLTFFQFILTLVLTPIIFFALVRRAFLLTFTGRNTRKNPHQGLRYISEINNDKSCHCVIVPHYYFFPESEFIKQKIVLYLPDYMPYFFEKTGEFAAVEKDTWQIGKKIADKADVVLCNSNFTREYLPDCKLEVNPKKIRVCYLPNLNASIESNGDRSSNKLTAQPSLGMLEIAEKVRDQTYLFYPTQPRPNKNLSFLLNVFAKLKSRGFAGKLVLTKKLDADPRALAVYQKMLHRKDVVFIENVDDTLLAALYRGCSLIPFTSLAEGNFPPQLQEALSYDVPIVAFNLGFITERLPLDRDKPPLMLVAPGDMKAFVKACEYALSNSDEILKKQESLKIYLDEQANQFSQKIMSVLELESGV